MKTYSSIFLLLVMACSAQAGNITTNVQGNGASGSINIGGVQSYRQ